MNDNEINRNMRCIEISYQCTYSEQDERINRNMRCIEINPDSRF